MAKNVTNNEFHLELGEESSKEYVDRFASAYEEYLDDTKKQNKFATGSLLGLGVLFTGLLFGDKIVDGCKSVGAKIKSKFQKDSVVDGEATEVSDETVEE